MKRRNFLSAALAAPAGAISMQTAYKKLNAVGANLTPAEIEAKRIAEEKGVVDLPRSTSSECSLTETIFVARITNLTKAKKLLWEPDTPRHQGQDCYACHVSGFTLRLENGNHKIFPMPTLEIMDIRGRRVGLVKHNIELEELFRMASTPLVEKAEAMRLIMKKLLEDKA